jgi:CheY-like chemotaxis protein
VLVIEDEALIVVLLEEMLLALDCEMTDVAANFQEGLLAAQNGSFDLALVDLKLGGKSAYPIADILKTRRVPFAFVTGYGPAGLDAAYADIPVLEKPFHRKDLKAIIARILTASKS